MNEKSDIEPMYLAIIPVAFAVVICFTWALVCWIEADTKIKLAQITQACTKK